MLESSVVLWNRVLFLTSFLRRSAYSKVPQSKNMHPKISCRLAQIWAKMLPRFCQFPVFRGHLPGFSLFEIATWESFSGIQIFDQNYLLNIRCNRKSRNQYVTFYKLSHEIAVFSRDPRPRRTLRSFTHHYIAFDFPQQISFFLRSFLSPPFLSHSFPALTNGDCKSGEAIQKKRDTMTKHSSLPPKYGFKIERAENGKTPSPVSPLSSSINWLCPFDGGNTHLVLTNPRLGLLLYNSTWHSLGLCLGHVSLWLRFRISFRISIDAYRFFDL